MAADIAGATFDEDRSIIEQDKQRTANSSRLFWKPAPMAVAVTAYNTSSRGGVGGGATKIARRTTTSRRRHRRRRWRPRTSSTGGLQLHQHLVALVLLLSLERPFFNRTLHSAPASSLSSFSTCCTAATTSRTAWSTTLTTTTPTTTRRRSRFYLDEQKRRRQLAFVSSATTDGASTTKLPMRTPNDEQRDVVKSREDGDDSDAALNRLQQQQQRRRQQRCCYNAGSRRKFLLATSPPSHLLMAASFMTWSNLPRRANAVVVQVPQSERGVFEAGKPLGIDDARKRFDAARESLNYLIENYDDIVGNGGGDNIRRYLGTVGTTSGMYGITKVMKELQEEAADVVEYTENMNDFGYALNAADAAAYSSNFSIR